MKMEDFKYGDPERFIEDKYVLNDDEFVLVIEKDIFDEETVKYASGIVEKYLKEKDNIIEFLLEKRLRSFYKNIFSDEYIKSHLGKPQITIISKKDESNPNWNHNYWGAIDYVECELDGHIISVEFLDDLDLIDRVQVDG